MATGFEEVFDPSGLASVDPPYYIRKIDRRRDWRGDETMARDAKVENAVAKVFPSDDGKISVFRIEGAHDLHRVAIGMNSYRPSLRERLDLLCITPDEFAEVGLHLEQSPGETNCFHANGLHYDIIYDQKAIKLLVNNLRNRTRKCGRLTEGKMKIAAQSALKIGCRATDSDRSSCECET